MQIAAPDTPSSRPLVLLLEDDVDTREMYHMALEFDGCHVVDSLTATEVVSRAGEMLPDVIVTDIVLRGDADGIAVAEHLKANPRTAAIPVLAVTGVDPLSLRARPGLFERVLLKPVLPDFLSAEIRRLLKRQVERGPADGKLLRPND